MDLAAKSAKLQTTLQELGSVLVAYSGGTDSAYLAYAAHQALGEKMLAVIADSASLPRAELAAALAFAAEHYNPNPNPPNQRARKPRLPAQRRPTMLPLQRRALHPDGVEPVQQQGFAHIAYGMNLDDRSDFRPGQQAAVQHHAVAPLVTAQLTKQEIRALAQQAGLTLWNKPASACLSSRIEYGRPVTRENLSQVEQAEAALHALGFPQVRVRHHGDLARVEIAIEDLPRALSMPVLESITAAIKPLGFLYVTIDTEGYRSGSMNQGLLAASTIRPAS